MDARVYFHLLDSIAAASTTLELAEMWSIVETTAMHRLERDALERSMFARERLLRVSEIEIERPSARAD